MKITRGHTDLKPPPHAGLIAVCADRRDQNGQITDAGCWCEFLLEESDEPEATRRRERDIERGVGILTWTFRVACPQCGGPVEIEAPSAGAPVVEFPKWNGVLQGTPYIDRAVLEAIFNYTRAHLRETRCAASRPCVRTSSRRSGAEMRVKIVGVVTRHELEATMQDGLTGEPAERRYHTGGRTRCTVQLTLYVLSGGPLFREIVLATGKPGDEARLGEEFDL